MTRQPFMKQYALTDLTAGEIRPVNITVADRDSISPNRNFNKIKVYNGSSEQGGESDINICFGGRADTTTKKRVPARHLHVISGFKFQSLSIENNSAITQNSEVLVEVINEELSHKGIQSFTIPLTKYKPVTVSETPTRVMPGSGIPYYTTNFDPATLPTTDHSGTITKDTAAGKFHTGNGSIKIVSQVGDKGAVGFRTWVPPGIFNTKAGMETVFLIADFTNASYLEFVFQFNDGTNAHLAKIKYDHVNTKLQYWSSGGSYADVTGGAITLTAGYWIRFKLILDLVNNKYHKLIIQNKEYDLSAIAYQLPAGATYKSESYVRFYPVAAQQITGYIDSMTFTEKE